MKEGPPALCRGSASLTRPSRRPCPGQCKRMSTRSSEPNKCAVGALLHSPPPPPPPPAGCPAEWAASIRQRIATDSYRAIPEHTRKVQRLAPIQIAELLSPGHRPTKAKQTRKRTSAASCVKAIQDVHNGMLHTVCDQTCSAHARHKLPFFSVRMSCDSSCGRNCVYGQRSRFVRNRNLHQNCVSTVVFHLSCVFFRIIPCWWQWGMVVHTPAPPPPLSLV